MIMRTFAQWLGMLGGVLAIYWGLTFYKNSPQQSAKANQQAKQTALDNANSEIAKLDEKYSQEKLEKTRADAKKARETLRSMAQWRAAEEMIRNNGIQPVVNMAPLGANLPNAIHVEVTLPFRNIPADKQHIDRIVEMLVTLDKTFGGCQRVQLSLPRTSGALLPRGEFSDDSEAVYSFNVANTEAATAQQVQK